MYRTALQMYKDTEFRHLSNKEITKRLLLSCIADYNDITVRAMPASAVHAQQVLMMLSEHLNPHLPNEEFQSIHNILWKLNYEFNKVTLGDLNMSKEVVDTLNFLIDILGD